MAFDEALEITEGLSIEWRRAGHILGSVLLGFDIDGRKLVFLGDLGRQHDAVMKPPTPLDAAD